MSKLRMNQATYDLILELEKMVNRLDSAILWRDGHSNTATDDAEALVEKSRRLRIEAIDRGAISVS